MGKSSRVQIIIAPQYQKKVVSLAQKDKNQDTSGYLTNLLESVSQCIRLHRIEISARKRPKGIWEVFGHVTKMSKGHQEVAEVIQGH